MARRKKAAYCKIVKVKKLGRRKFCYSKKGRLVSNKPA